MGSPTPFGATHIQLVMLARVFYFFFHFAFFCLDFSALFAKFISAATNTVYKLESNCSWQAVCFFPFNKLNRNEVCGEWSAMGGCEPQQWKIIKCYNYFFWQIYFWMKLWISINGCIKPMDYSMHPFSVIHFSVARDMFNVFFFCLFSLLP